MLSPTCLRSIGIKRIIVTPHDQFRGLFCGLIRSLNNFGAVIRIVVANRQKAQYWRQAASGLNNVTVEVGDRLYSVAREPIRDLASVIRRARSIEDELGITINHLSVRDRHLGRGYALGGFYHPRSRISENCNYHQMIAAYVAEFDFWRSEIERFDPDLILNCGEIPWRLAMKSCRNYRVLAGSRHGGLYQWAHSEYFENPAVEEQFRAIGNSLDPIDQISPYTANAIYVSKFASSIQPATILTDNIRALAQFAYWKIRGYEKAKGYYLRDNIRHRWFARSAYKKMTSRTMVTLEKLKGQPFVYYPLHTEPEAALQGLSPEYTFQLETIVRLARVLPAGILLAVKETQPAIGRRPKDFYDQIADLKNVVLINIEERGVDVVAASAAVATITGTAGLEAAVLGKPVISFGFRNQYGFLTHVFQVRDEDSLRRSVNLALATDFDFGRAALDGARFLQALKDISFDLLGYDFMQPDVVCPEMIEVLTEALVASVKHHQTVA